MQKVWTVKRNEDLTIIPLNAWERRRDLITCMSSAGGNLLWFTPRSHLWEFTIHVRLYFQN